MSTYRIKGDDGVIVDSAKYLELPKGPDSARPTNPRAGMMRYNDQATSRGIEASVIVESAGKQSLEWRRVAHLDKDGKMLTSQLPSTITGSLTYKGTWNADYNDVNETADDVSLNDRLPAATGRVGHYYIVRTNGDGGVARGQAPTDLAPVTSNPKYRKGDWIVSNGATWEKVDQSQITTTAAQVQLVTTSMRPNKHAMGTSVSLQDAMDGLVEHALDRFEDTILGTITVSNDKNAYPDARILLADGSAAKPNLAFGTSPTTGLYWAAANTIGFSAEGNMKLTLNPTVLTSAVTFRNIPGSAGTPSYSFTDSAKAGMYRVGADIVGISTGGAERARFYADGIRTLTLLANKGSTDKVAYGFTEADDKHTPDIGTGIYSPAAKQVTIATNKAQTATFSESQVTTLVPVRVSAGSTKLPSLSFTGDNTTGVWLNGTGKLSLSATEVEAMTITKTSVSTNIQSLFFNGTATAPGLAFASDHTTGIFSDATDTISFAAKGVKQLTISDAGAVFTNPIQINTGTGNVKIGSNNSSWIHFIGDKAFHFNKQVQAEGGFKVYNKDTALQSDGKIKEDGKLLEDKYVQLTGNTSATSIYAPGTKNIEVEKNSSIYWYNSTDFAKITFEHNGVDAGTDQHMLFETGDNDNEYFKFAHRLGGATANTEWMSIKKDGIAVSGKTNTIGDWTVSTSGLQFKGSNVISIDASGNVTVNGSSTSSSGVNKAGDTMTGQLKINNQGFANALTEVNGTKAALLIPNASFPVTDGTYYQEFIHGSCTRETNGYIQHGSMGIKRSGTSNWQQLYLATGGSDASPTKEWLFDYTGTLTSPGDIFVGTDKVYHTGNKPTLAELGAAPSGFGLGTYASIVKDVNTDLRTTCGFFTGWNMTNRPAWPMAANTLDYIFNAAFGNPRGYNGMIAMDFEGQGLAFKTIFDGVDKGWKYVYHTGYKPTAADVGALALTGGSCSGAVSATSFSTAGGVTCTSVSVGSGRVNCGSVLATGTIEALKFTAGTGGITSTGAITSSGSITAYSDRSLKKDIIDLDSSLETVMKLRPVKYVMKADKLEKVQVGFIAQEVQEVIPEVVVEHDDGLLSMDYSRVVAYLVGAVQELQAEVERLKRGE